jgi:biotin-(acetyl-CoA carboxylase) ligase
MKFYPKRLVGTSSIYPKATYDKMMKRLAELEKDREDTDVAEIRKVKAEHFARLEKEMEVGKSTESEVEVAVNVDKGKQDVEKEEGNEKGRNSEEPSLNF